MKQLESRTAVIIKARVTECVIEKTTLILLILIFCCDTGGKCTKRNKVKKHLVHYLKKKVFALFSINKKLYAQLCLACEKKIDTRQ